MADTAAMSAISGSSSVGAQVSIAVAKTVQDQAKASGAEAISQIKAAADVAKSQGSAAARGASGRLDVVG